MWAGGGVKCGQGGGIMWVGRGYNVGREGVKCGQGEG